MENLIGKKFGKLVPIRYIEKYKYLCRCDCDKEIIVTSANLKNGHTKSCGCLLKEKLTKHGHTIKNNRSKTYLSWDNMIQRCTNPNNPEYKDYGGRNPPIIVCDRWNPKSGGSFKNFLIDVGEIPKGLTFNRINNNKGYNPKNFNIITNKEQQRNKRNNKLITFNGRTQCMSAWAEEYNINTRTLYARLHKLNWPIEKALTTPVRIKGKLK